MKKQNDRILKEEFPRSVGAQYATGDQWRNNSRVSRRKEIIKIRAEINEKETKETIAKVSKAKSLFFKKINKIDKLLARLIKKKNGEDSN